MNTAENINVVHESEAQRQYARVRMPIVLEMVVEEGGVKKQKRYTVHDISAGGFGLQCTKQDFQAGKIYQGTLKINIDGFTLGLEASFQARNIQSGSTRVGFEFQDIGPREISALRYLITSYLSGELVTVGDMLNTLSRENFTKARKSSGSGSSWNSRVKALAGSVAFFFVGVMAAGFVAGQLYDTYFVTASKSAVLMADTYQIDMPRDGVVKPLVAMNTEVKKGQAIATFDSPILDFLKTEMVDSMNSESLEMMTETYIKGTLTSPCDCIVLDGVATEGQFVPKGTPVMRLGVKDVQPYVLATFDFNQVEELARGARVEVEIIGDAETYYGSIEHLTIAGQGKSATPGNSVEARIILDSMPAQAPVGHPAIVKKTDLPLSFVSSAVAKIGQ
ncbi:PilZ domain-containing protein [Hahella ganghwensis]|uniref:PilZ domain-containing protein n=1 Tax=Hahella ganghwensis TaxID=286420 RepID=UPI0003805CF3|nr:PilZ domain-containing protein [Hahella ganghwensis]